jgi:proteasome lid subunit RPN8/RPN11
VEKKQKERIIIPINLWRSMSTHVHAESPLEACGILGGEQSGSEVHAKWSFPARNELHSTHLFRIDPHDQLCAFNELEQRGLDLVGIYHSHPYGPPSPSATDIEQAYYPDAVQLIWAFDGDKWECRSFLIQAGLVQEIPLTLSNQNQDKS